MKLLEKHKSPRIENKPSRPYILQKCPPVLMGLKQLNYQHFPAVKLLFKTSFQQDLNWKCPTKFK